MTRVDSKTAASYLNTRSYVYLDVRTPEEFAEGRVRGAVNIPFTFATGLNTKFVEQVRQRFQGSKQLIVLGCRSGNRSARAAALLAPFYPNMVEHADGYIGWVAAKLPVTK
jgi:rhodanese-related sulfurtransferase